MRQIINLGTLTISSKDGSPVNIDDFINDVISSAKTVLEKDNNIIGIVRLDNEALINFKPQEDN